MLWKWNCLKHEQIFLPPTPISFPPYFLLSLICFCVHAEVVHIKRKKVKLSVLLVDNYVVKCMDISRHISWMQYKRKGKKMKDKAWLIVRLKTFRRWNMSVMKCNHGCAFQFFELKNHLSVKFTCWSNNVLRTSEADKNDYRTVSPIEIYLTHSYCLVLSCHSLVHKCNPVSVAAVLPQTKKWK